jgi:uncharacterized protein with beta-barrel porin domain
MKKTALAVFAFLLALSGCAARRVGDILGNPARYQGREVTVKGMVTQSTGAIFAGTYLLDDGTGRIRVITNSPVPPKGTPIQVRGRLQSGVTLGNRSFGTTVQENDRRVLRSAPGPQLARKP